MTTPNPTATVTITPMGRHTAFPRDHLIEVMINLGEGTTPFADKGYVAAVVRKSLASFPAASATKIGNVSVSKKGKHNEGVISTVIGVEGSAVSHGRPENDAVEQLRAALLDAEYNAVIREKRECGEPGCPVGVMVDWNRPAKVPSGWYSNQVCGRHNYRQCPQCNSVYLMTHTSSAGQAPAVHCEVCGIVLFEWGSSKVWHAELVTRGEGAVALPK